MQISAANLLLAGQQAHPVHSGRAAGDAFAHALAQGAVPPQPAKTVSSAPFVPSHFETDAPAAAVAVPAKAPAALLPPGSTLDIRV